MKLSMKFVLVELAIGIIATIVGSLIYTYISSGLLNSQFFVSIIILVLAVGLAETGAYFFAKKYGTPKLTALVIAFLFMTLALFLAFPQSLVDYSYQASYSISTAGPAQQFTTPQALFQQGSAIDKIPSGLLIEQMYEQAADLHSPIFMTVSVLDSSYHASSQMFVALGVSSDSYIANNVSTHIFLIDSTGLIQGTYPAGDYPLITYNSNNGYYPTSNSTGFAVQATSLNRGVLSSSDLTALKEGKLIFSFNIPKSPLSIGAWKIFVFLQNETGGPYYYTGGSILAAATNSFNVTPQPTSLNSAFYYGEISTLSIGTFAFGYGVLDKIIQKDFYDQQVSIAWVRRNWTIPLGLVSLAIFFLIFVI